MYNSGHLSRPVNGLQHCYRRSSDSFSSVDKKDSKIAVNHSTQSALFRSQTKRDYQNGVVWRWWNSCVLAVAIFSITATTGPLSAHASLEISPGTTVVQTSPELTPIKFVQSSIGTAFKAALRALIDGRELTQSLQRLQSAVSSEAASTPAWQNLWSILQQYGLDVQKQITIRPPQDMHQTLQDLVQEGKVNFIVNGEVIQMSLEYRGGSNDGIAIGGSKSSSVDTTPLSPDDEWILKIEGYRGLDPNAIDPNKYNDRLPRFVQNFLEYCNTPYPEKYLSDFLIPSKKGQRVVKYGDIVLLEGTLAVGFLYAWSYAYYMEGNEKAEKSAKTKLQQAQQRNASASAKKEVSNKEAMEHVSIKSESSASFTWDAHRLLPHTSDTVLASAVVEEPETVMAAKNKHTAFDVKGTGRDEIATLERAGNAKKEVEEDIKVSINFDSNGDVVIRATENKSRGGILVLLQALWFPWLGMLIPSLTAPETVVIRSDEEQTEGFLRFLGALYLPWFGLLRGK